jgi:hypothetical protein
LAVHSFLYNFQIKIEYCNFKIHHNIHFYLLMLMDDCAEKRHKHKCPQLLHLAEMPSIESHILSQRCSLYCKSCFLFLTYC